MKSIKQSFSVPYEYRLHFTAGLFNESNTLFNEILCEYNKSEKVKLFFVLDDGVLKHHPNLLDSITNYCQVNSASMQYTNSIIVPGGEQSKNNSKYVDEIIKGVSVNAICRHSFVIAIGGGAVIDMAGYAAAIAHRGVKLIRIPTTTLSQNDSAVGVKNSVNALGKKNFLGTFAPPYAIINDSEFLKTLEQRDWIAGIAEAVKVSLIKDETFFKYIEDNATKLEERLNKPMQHVIYKCAEMHMEHIAQGGDPFESGSSRPLDFGHWAAHKLEQMTGYSLRHGEAVAKGIALDVTYATQMGLVSEGELSRILNTMQRIGFDLEIPVYTEKEIDILLAGIEEFREHLGGELTITLISGIGKKHDVHYIDTTVMKKAIKVLNEMCKINAA